MITNKIIIGSSEGAAFEPLPADMYQVVIDDVTERMGTKLNTNEPQPQLMFKSIVIEGEHKGRFVYIFTSQSWFDGGTNSKPSKLYTLVKNVYTFYEPKAKLKDIQEINTDMINNLVGKQLRITVEVTPSNKNKVTGFMSIKEEQKVEKEAISADIDL